VLERPDANGLTRGLRQAYGRASQENASDSLDYQISDLYMAASEESKAKLLTGFKSAPFVEPANGLANFRDRWYDASTGSWTSPDAESYSAGSSNLYAGLLNDPVNQRDPTGNEPFTVAVIGYLGWVALNTGIDVTVDAAFNEIGDWWSGEETEFDWHDSLQTNFAINLATGGIGGKAAKLKYLAKLKNPVVRNLAAEGVEYVADVGATGTIDMFYHGQSAAEAYGSAAVGGIVGRSVSHGLRISITRFKRQSGYVPLNPRFNDATLGYRERFNNALAEAGEPSLPRDWDMHHTIQQRMAQPSHPFHHIATGRDVHHPSRGRGVRGSRQKGVLTVIDSSGRVRRTNPHAEMDREIREFLRRSPTQGQYDDYLDYLDWRWQHTFWESGAGH